MADRSIPQRASARKQYLDKLRSALRVSRQATPLSSMFSDPMVRAAFQRAERDNGAAFAIPAPKAPVLNGGVAMVAEFA